MEQLSDLPISWRAVVIRHIRSDNKSPPCKPRRRFGYELKADANELPASPGSLELVARGKLEGPRRTCVHKQWSLRAHRERLVEDVFHIEPERPILVKAVADESRGIPHGFERNRVRCLADRIRDVGLGGEVVAARLGCTAANAEILQRS